MEEEKVYSRVAEIVRTNRDRSAMMEAVKDILQAKNPRLASMAEKDIWLRTVLRIGVRELVGEGIRASTASASSAGEALAPVPITRAPISSAKEPIRAGIGAGSYGAAFAAVQRGREATFYKRFLLPNGRSLEVSFPEDLPNALKSYEGKDVGILQKKIFITNLYNKATPGVLIPKSVPEDEAQKLLEAAGKAAGRAIQRATPALKPVAEAS